MGDLTQTFIIALVAFVLIIMGLVWNPYKQRVSEGAGACTDHRRAPKTPYKSITYSVLRKFYFEKAKMRKMWKNISL